MKNVIVYLFIFTWPHPVYASIGAHSFLGKMRECVLDFLSVAQGTCLSL